MNIQSRVNISDRSSSPLRSEADVGHHIKSQVSSSTSCGIDNSVDGSQHLSLVVVVGEVERTRYLVRATVHNDTDSSLVESNIECTDDVLDELFDLEEVVGAD